MENSGVGLDCCGCAEDGSRLESAHGTNPTDHPDLSPTSVDHHHVALATTKIIERAGIKENTLLPNGKLKHRTDENGLINHRVLTTGSSDASDLLGAVTSGLESDRNERCTPSNASFSSTKNVTNNQSSCAASSSGGDSPDGDGDGDKPSSLSIQSSRTHQSHGNQVDSISQQIDTLNISARDNNTPATSPSDTATNISNNATASSSELRVATDHDDENNHVDVKTNDDDNSAGVPCFPPARADNDAGTVAVNYNNGESQLEYRVYECELQMADIMKLITRDLSEPYSIYTYRYFIHNWPKLCFLCMDSRKCVGAIVCKLDIHKRVIRRGYIAMLAVDAEYRRRKIGSNLVLKAIRAMLTDGCDEVVLETEITNKAALKLYENLGFVRDKRLFRYYLNGVDALRLKLWLR